MEPMPKNCTSDPQGSMGYGDGVVSVSWRGRVERVAMGCGLGGDGVRR